MRPDRVWFSGCFVLNGVSISSLSVLHRVSLHDLMDKSSCLFIGLLKNEAYFNEVKVICKGPPMDAIVIHCHLLIVNALKYSKKLVYSYFIIVLNRV